MHVMYVCVCVVKLFALTKPAAVQLNLLRLNLPYLNLQVKFFGHSVHKGLRGAQVRVL